MELESNNPAQCQIVTIAPQTVRNVMFVLKATSKVPQQPVIPEWTTVLNAVMVPVVTYVHLGTSFRQMGQLELVHENLENILRLQIYQH